jgi:hypothetical protein
MNRSSSTTDTQELTYAMVPSMLVAMLLRRAEYSGDAHSHGELQPVAA